MADEDLSLDDVDEEATEGTEGEAAGSKKKLIIIIAAAVVGVLLIGGVAAYFMFSGSEEPTEAEITEVEGSTEESAAGESVKEAPAETKKVEQPPKGDAIYISVPDPFLVNIKSGKRTRMMQIKIQFMVRSNEAEDMVKLHMPLIRNDLLDYFSLADATEVQTREGRNALKDGSLTVAQEVMKAQVGYEAIEMVLYTGFVVQ
ncbi:MAG: flagellar basal body-associated protein FliL [Gammaproteobacteria bacterium]|nr:MAG: flagellar basal body-associated protein FliL [Gammaproteobacteria bacterium]